MELTTPRIHVIEKLRYITRLGDEEWESGFWRVTPETAESLINGQMFFHSSQEERSHFGGMILSFRLANQAEIARDADFEGRIVFRIKAANDFKGVKADAGGWAMEKKIVL